MSSTPSAPRGILNSTSLMQKPARGWSREVTAHEREGINPSPTKKSVGAGFIPARASTSFAGGS